MGSSSCTSESIVAAVVCGAVVDNVALRVRLGAWQPFNVPSLVAPFAVCIMLRSDTSWVLPLAATVGLLSKHVLRIDGRHFHNPSNVAVLFALLAFPADTTIQRLDWGHVPWMIGIIFTAGVLLTTRARLFDNSVLYHAVLAAMLWGFVTKNPDRITFQLMNGGVLLYSFFIQNDPRVLPRTRLFRYAFVVIAAAGQVVFQLTWGPKDVNTMLSLATASMLVPLFRRTEEVWTGPRVRAAVAVVAYALPAIALTLLYRSDFNFKRNLRESIGTAKAAAKSEPQRLEAAYQRVAWHPAGAPSKSEEGLATLVAARFGAARPELYETSWTESHAVRVPFREAPRQRMSFSREVANVEFAAPLPGPEWYGEDNNIFASVSAGDIDHDGSLDLVLGSPPYALSVFLNDGNGRFVDAAPALFEGEVPRSIEHAALVDIDSDGWLDLVLARSHYRPGTPSGVWRFDPAARKFRPTGVSFGAGKTNAGGLAFADINGDRRLDFYVSYGVDSSSIRVNYMNFCGRDEFYLSTGDFRWKSAYEATFSKNMTKDPFVGMTTLFADVNLDGKLDFLIGHDYNHPSMLAFGDGARFTLSPKETVEVNTRNSMSYFPIDFDGDGTLELWENGIAFDYSTAWVAGLIAERSKAPMTVYDDELLRYMIDRAKGLYACQSFTDPRVIALCDSDILSREAGTKSDLALCEKHKNITEIGRCKRDIRMMTRVENFDPSMGHYDVEVFPKKMHENSLLKFDAETKRYRRLRLGRDVEYTGFSWAAYPFDLDNDGREELHVATGFFGEAHTRNRLLHNESKPGQIVLVDVAGDLGVDVLDDGRGTVIADLDGDGDGDVIVNGSFVQPLYWRNQTGGRALEIELRSKRSNYYGLGSRVTVKTSARTQTRQVWSGGVWGSYQPPVLHYGLADDERIEDIEIVWPDGHREHREGLSPAARWIVYE